MAQAIRLSGPLFSMIGEIMHANARLKTVFAEAIAATGLSSMAYAVLTMIADADEPITVAQMGRALSHARQVIQRGVNELIAANLVEALPNPSHKRAALLTLTPQGYAFKQRSNVRVTAIATRLLRHVDPDLCRRIARDLERLREQTGAFMLARTQETVNLGEGDEEQISPPIDTKMSL
ncbi:MAG: helix-turn-helix domain-containing protein [Novosphingobium sp.]